jgi:hypothetical protein
MGEAICLFESPALMSVPGTATGAAKALNAIEAESMAMNVPLSIMMDI